MFGRGRGNQHHNDRRSSGGNTQTKDFRNNNTPQVGQKDHPLFGSQNNRDRMPNNRHGGKPDNSPRPKKDDPPKEDSSKGGNKSGRPRSRSPVNRNAQTKNKAKDNELSRNRWLIH